MIVRGGSDNPGRGMIVGESRVFRGNPGRLLNAALREVEIDLGMVYISDLPLLGKTPIHRPSVREVDSWWPHFRTDIEDMNPRAILALGDVAHSAFDAFELDVSRAWHPQFVLGWGVRGHDTVYDDWLDQITVWADEVKS